MSKGTSSAKFEFVLSHTVHSEHVSKINLIFSSSVLFLKKIVKFELLFSQMNSSNQAFPVRLPSFSTGTPGSGRASPGAGLPASRQASPVGSSYRQASPVGNFAASLQQLVSFQGRAPRQEVSGSSSRSTTPVPSAAHGRAGSADVAKASLPVARDPYTAYSTPLLLPRGRESVSGASGEISKSRPSSLPPPSRPVPPLPPSPRDSQREPGLSSARRQAGLAGVASHSPRQKF